MCCSIEDGMGYPVCFHRISLEPSGSLGPGSQATFLLTLLPLSAPLPQVLCWNYYSASAGQFTSFRFSTVSSLLNLIGLLELSVSFCGLCTAPGRGVHALRPEPNLELLLEARLYPRARASQGDSNLKGSHFVHHG
jgi:hypothetical protein